MLVSSDTLSTFDVSANVQGTDLVLLLAAESARLGHRWYLLGGAADTATRAADALRSRFPGLQVVGADPGSAWPADDAVFGDDLGYSQ